MEEHYLHHRRSIRLPKYDYSTPGYYLVGMETKGRKEYFGYLKNEKMIFNKLGYLVKKYLKEIPNHFSNIKIDSFNILPNHIHLIILIKGKVRWGAPWRAPTTEPVLRKFGPLIPGTLSTIINSYKSTVTRKINKARFLRKDEILWQVNYFERVIRDESELQAFRQYIQDNPMRHWNKINPK